MRATAKALKEWIGSFGLPAYMRGAVPEKTAAPYLVYPLTEPEWREKATFYIQGWYRSTDLTALTEKADEIVKEIGEGITLKTDSGGYLVIYPGSPLIQIDKSGDYRYFYINLSLNSYQMPGAFPDPPEEPETPVEPDEPEEPEENEPGASPEEGD